jgi:hypothetical protein
MYTQFANVAAVSELEAHGLHPASVNSRTLKASCAFTIVRDDEGGGGGDDYDNNKWQRRTAICRNMVMK